MHVKDQLQTELGEHQSVSSKIWYSIRESNSQVSVCSVKWVNLFFFSVSSGWHTVLSLRLAVPSASQCVSVPPVWDVYVLWPFLNVTFTSTPWPFCVMGDYKLDHITCWNNVNLLVKVLCYTVSHWNYYMAFMNDFMSLKLQGGKR